MVSQHSSERRSRGFLMPVIGGLLLIGGLIVAIAFRAELWRAVKWLGGQFSTWLTEWVPDHPGQTAAITGFVVVAFLLNWIAHIRGRLRSWIFAIVVEMGLWLLFWYGLGIPPLNELLGLNIDRMTLGVVVLSGVIVVTITGALFWFLESREEWRKYRRRHDVDED